MLEELEKDYDHVTQKLKESNNIEGHLRDRLVLSSFVIFVVS